jgi:DNA-directed RNA polymerase specialized sigma24 family protein
VQEVLLVLVPKLPEFTYDPEQSFRGWLRTITLNKWRQRCRRLPLLDAF